MRERDEDTLLPVSELPTKQILAFRYQPKEQTTDISQETAGEIEWHGIIALITQSLLLILQQSVVNGVAMHGKIAVLQCEVIVLTIIIEVFPCFGIVQPVHLISAALLHDLYAAVTGIGALQQLSQLTAALAA